MKVIQNLPEVFEEFHEQRRKSFLEIKEYKDRGIPVIGMYCAYFPVELAMAIGAIPVGLCSFADETIPAAEKELPKNLCPLIKSSYGFAIEDKCPFFHFADLVIGETTCDGKKKMYELMAEFKSIFVMNLPNSQSEHDCEFWKKEVIRTKEYIEEFFNVVITDEMLSDAIKLGNRIRKSLKDLCEIMKLNPAPILGKDLQKLITGSKYRFDFQSTPEIVNSIREKILDEYKKGKMLEKRPRIMLTGCPVGGDSMKVIEAIEENGGVVVAVENCSGVKTLDRMIDEENPDLLGAVAERYLATGCSIMTPNDQRIDLLGRIIDEYQVDGVVEMILSGCHSTGVESIYIRKFVNKEKGLPYLAVETAYSKADYAQISTRISALMEMIQMEKSNRKQIDMNQCYKILFSNYANGVKVEEILEKLWEYTGVKIIISDEKKGIILSAGCSQSEKETSSFEYRIERKIHGKSGKIVAGLPCQQIKKKGEELLEMIEKIYLAKKPEATVDTGSGIKRGEPDYLWILIKEENGDQTLGKYLKDDFHIVGDENGKDYRSYLFSGISGEKERNELINRCKKYEEVHRTFIKYVVIGNGFSEKSKSNENKDLLQRVIKLGQKLNANKSIFLIEDYYQELALECILENIDQKSYVLKEVELIKKDDEQKGGNLYETLYWYLLMNRNAAQAAAKLQIHRNTLIPRIARLNELINLDDLDGEQCERILMAMQLEKMENLVTSGT